MLSAHSVRRLVAAAGIAGLGATLTATTAHAAPAQSVPRIAPMMAQPDTATTDTAPAAAPAAPAAPAATYTVISGDTLSEIAQARNIPGNWQALYELNKGQLPDGPDWIDIGQVLELAGVATAPAPAPAAPKTTPSTPTTSTEKTSTKPKTQTNSSSSAASSSSSSSKLTLDAATRAKTTTTSSSAKTSGATVSAPSSSKAATAVAFAKAQLGKPYVYGADGPDAYDCSGLVQAAWNAAGVSLPRITNDQFADGTRVSTSNLQPGDLVFYYSGISHVGIYIGDGKIIHAPNPRTVVKIADVDSMPIAGATRPA